MLYPYIYPSEWTEYSIVVTMKRLFFSLLDMFARRKLLGSFMSKPYEGLCVVDANAGDYPYLGEGASPFAYDIVDYRFGTYYRALRKQIKFSEKDVRVIGIITKQWGHSKPNVGDVNDYINLLVVREKDIYLGEFLVKYPEYKDKETVILPFDDSHFVVSKSVWKKKMLTWLEKELAKPKD